MSSKGFVRSQPATVTLTTGANQATSTAADTGVITSGIWNGKRLEPCYLPASAITGGTVTSVAATVPAEFTVAGSPITTTGTLAITKATQTANKVWASATSGGAAQPAFRALVAADIPTIPASGVSGLAAVATSGSATDLTTGTLPTGRLTGSYTGITTLGTVQFAAGSFSAPSVAIGEATSGLFNNGSHKVAFTSNAQASGPQVYHDGSRYRMEFPTAGSWLLWTNGTNGVVLQSQTFNSTNDGILAIGGFGGAAAGVDFNGRARIKNTSGTNISFLNTAETANAGVWHNIQVENSAANFTATATTSWYLYSGIAGARTVTLPLASVAVVGMVVAVTGEGGATATIAVPASTTVQVGAATWSASSSHANAAGGAVILVCTGAGASATWAALSLVGTWT